MVANVEDSIAKREVGDLKTNGRLSDGVRREIDGYQVKPAVLTRWRSKAETNEHLPDLEIVDGSADKVTLSSAAPGAPALAADSEGRDPFKRNPAVQWGEKGEQKTFQINEDGSSTHVVKKGETVWSIVKAELWAKNGSEPSNQQIVDEVKHIRDANGHIVDPDKISIGSKINLPPDSTSAAAKADAERNDTIGTTISIGDSNVSIKHDQEGNLTVTTQAPGQPPDVWVQDKNNKRLWHHVGADGKPDGKDFHGDKSFDEHYNYVEENDDTKKRTIAGIDGKSTEESM
ncbi:hypothetical protein BH10CYA1_BH10CYA1_27910 [soil metagenome]